MIRSTLMLVALAIPSCKTTDRSSTRYWATSQSFATHMALVCQHGRVGDPRSRFDGSLPEPVQQFHSERCDLVAKDGTHAGFTTITMQGSRNSYDYKTTTSVANGFCAAYIGPTPIAAPVDPGLLVGFIEDPEVVAKLQPLFEHVDPNREYEVSATIDGIHVDVDQWSSMLDGPTIEMRVDSCARSLPDAEPPLHKLGGVLPFRTDAGREQPAAQ